MFSLHIFWLPVHISDASRPQDLTIPASALRTWLERIAPNLPAAQRWSAGTRLWRHADLPADAVAVEALQAARALVANPGNVLVFGEGDPCAAPLWSWPKGAAPEEAKSASLFWWPLIAEDLKAAGCEEFALSETDLELFRTLVALAGELDPRNVLPCPFFTRFRESEFSDEAWIFPVSFMEAASKGLDFKYEEPVSRLCLYQDDGRLLIPFSTLREFQEQHHPEVDPEAEGEVLGHYLQYLNALQAAFDWFMGECTFVRGPFADLDWAALEDMEPVDTLFDEPMVFTDHYLDTLPGTAGFPHWSDAEVVVCTECGSPDLDVMPHPVVLEGFRGDHAIWRKVLYYVPCQNESAFYDTRDLMTEDYGVPVIHCQTDGMRSRDYAFVGVEHAATLGEQGSSLFLLEVLIQFDTKAQAQQAQAFPDMEAFGHFLEKFSTGLSQYWGEVSGCGDQIRLMGLNGLQTPASMRKSVEATDGAWPLNTPDIPGMYEVKLEAGRTWLKLHEVRAGFCNTGTLVFPEDHPLEPFSAGGTRWIQTGPQAVRVMLPLLVLGPRYAVEFGYLFDAEEGRNALPSPQAHAWFADAFGLPQEQVQFAAFGPASILIQAPVATAAQGEAAFA